MKLWLKRQLIGLMKEVEHDLSPGVFYHQFRSLKRAPRAARHVVR
jgi:hypothetical protein